MKHRHGPSALIKAWRGQRLLPVIGRRKLPASDVHFARSGTQPGTQSVIVLGDLVGAQHLLLIAFDADGARAFDSWIPLAYRLSQLHPTFFYSRLFAAGGRGPDRWSPRERIARQPGSWVRIKRLSQFREEVTTLLGIPSKSKFCGVLVGSSGDIVWNEVGTLTVTKAAALVDAVSRQLSPEEL